MASKMITLPDWIFSEASTVYASFIEDGYDVARAMLQQLVDTRLSQESVDAMDSVVRRGVRDQETVIISFEAMEVLGLDKRIVTYCYSGHFLKHGKHYTGTVAFNEISALNGALVTEWQEGDRVPVCCNGEVWNRLNDDQRRQVKRVVTHMTSDLENPELAKHVVAKYYLYYDRKGRRIPSYNYLTCNNVVDDTKARCVRDIYRTTEIHKIKCIEEAWFKRVRFSYMYEIDDIFRRAPFGKLRRLKVRDLHFMFCNPYGGDSLPTPQKLREFLRKLEDMFELLEYETVVLETDFMSDFAWTDEKEEMWKREGEMEDLKVTLKWSNRKRVVFNGVEMPFSETELEWL